MTIFQHCRKVVTDPFGLEKASELARHLQLNTYMPAGLAALAVLVLCASRSGPASARMRCFVGTAWSEAHHG